MKWKLASGLILVSCVILQAAPVMAASSTTITGTVPLVTYDISVSNIGYHRATISWKTNGKATSQVFYDTEFHGDTANYAYHSAEDATLVTEHSIRLTGLSSETTYHYRVRSAISDTGAISDDYTFRTLSAGDGGDGDGGTAYYIETDLFGAEQGFRISRTGEILESIGATSADGMLTVYIPKGTIAKDKNDERLSGLEAAVNETPPSAPEGANIIRLPYDFRPAGATFDPPITLTWSYHPDTLPEGVAEEDLVIAYYDQDADKWVELDCTVDTENNSVTAKVSHFTTFAIMANLPPPPPLAAFAVSKLSISPTEVETGEEVTINIEVANIGGREGSHPVSLWIDGVLEETKEVTLAPGAVKIIAFAVTKGEPGTYMVKVDRFTDSFVVKERAAPPPPISKAINWQLVGGILAAIVLGLVIFLLVRRR